MASTVRAGSVAYLNARPLVLGFEQGVGGGRVELSHEVPARIAERMAALELDAGLIPSIELARLPGLEVVPGLAIASRGPARSVLLVGRRSPREARLVALDPESRTSNALARILFAEVWGGQPEFRTGPLELEAALSEHDAVVRIGDKALFEPLPDGVEVVDLGQAWTEATRLPFVWAVWACRQGILDHELYGLFHESRRQGLRAVELIAADYAWNGARHPEVSREYLTGHMRYRLGSSELRGLESFLGAAVRLGLAPGPVEIRMGLERWTECHETAASRGVIAKP